MNGDAGHSEEEPQPVAPEGYQQASAPDDNGECAEQGPTEALELIGVEPFLKARHEENQPGCQKDEADQTVALVKQFVEKGSGLRC